MKIIRIPRTPASAFDRNRPASDLLKAQVRHARAVEQALSPERIPATPVESIRTEHEVAEYLGAVTRQLHPAAARTRWKLPPGPRAPKSGVWLGPATVSKPRRKKARKTMKRRPKAAATRKRARKSATKARGSTARKRSTRARKTGRRR